MEKAKNDGVAKTPGFALALTEDGALPRALKNR